MRKAVIHSLKHLYFEATFSMGVTIKLGMSDELSSLVTTGQMNSPEYSKSGSAASFTKSLMRAGLSLNEDILSEYLKRAGISKSVPESPATFEALDSPTFEFQDFDSPIKSDVEVKIELQDDVKFELGDENIQTVSFHEQYVSSDYKLEEAKVGLKLLPDQCRLMAHKKGQNFTLMVAGKVGTGKTSFLNTLFGTELIKLTNLISTTKIEINKFKLIENNFQLNLTTIDTPGFGNKINNKYNWVPICNFIDDQFRTYLFQLEQPNRNKIIDNRVHCCLYFLELTGLSLTPLDIISMQNISKRVNLIPVISKSDILSKEELNQFKILIKNQLQVHKINVCELILDDQVKDKIYSSIPFAIIGTNEFNNKELIRKYSWGTVPIESENICDYTILKKLLLSENMLDLINSTEYCFNEYRLECLELRFKEIEKEAKIDNLSGFDQLKLYNQIGLKKFKEIEETHLDSINDIRQEEIRNRLQPYISQEETRFKEWKKKLVDKQASLNCDIEKEHKIMVNLQTIVENMEKTGSETPPELESLTECDDDNEIIEKLME